MALLIGGFGLALAFSAGPIGPWVIVALIATWFGRTHLYRMTGVDLTRTDGVDGFTALKVIGEIGTDMTKWPTAKHFASWLGLSPNNRITGGRVISSKTKPSANRAAAALRMAAHALHRSDSALGAFLRRKKAHLGAPKAITATAHKLARLIYTMLRYGQDYVDAWRRILREPVSAPCVARG